MSTTTKDKLIKSGKNEDGISYEIYKDASIGDYYLQIEGRSRPVYSGSKRACQTMADGWVA